MTRLPALSLLLGLAGLPLAAQTTADPPGNHGMFMVGQDTLFLLHMPMFHTGKHMYLMVLRADLPPAEMAAYQALRAAHPDTAYNLINVDDDTFTLPEVKSGSVTQFTATLFDGYANTGGGTPGPVLSDNVPVSIDDVVVFRHFNMSIDRPATLNYIIFGAGDEAFMTHYIARDPSFQHIVKLAAVPTWLSAPELVAGVTVSFPDLPSEPLVCASPLPTGPTTVNFEGDPAVAETLDLTGAVTIWYSTGNLLNTQDPCPE